MSTRDIILCMQDDVTDVRQKVESVEQAQAQAKTEIAVIKQNVETMPSRLKSDMLMSTLALVVLVVAAMKAMQWLIRQLNAPAQSTAGKDEACP